MTQVPTSSKILVIGGGPGGSYAATVLAREGFDVTLFERDVFPRYHIGESLLPSCRPFLKFIGAEELVKNHGFAEKPGAAVKLNQYKREGYTDFISLDPDGGAWNVVRSEFDELLLRHAARCGVSIFEGIKVNKINFDDTNTPVSAEWEGKDNEKGTVTFEYLVDASGRHGVMSTQYLFNRRFNKALRNVACWGYWKGTSKYNPSNFTNRENAPYFEALTDETGWCWFIPLHNGTVSVGVVLTEESSKLKKRAQNVTLEEHYLHQLKLVPGALGLIGKGELVSDIKSASDYSYSATNYAGPRYRLVGDAAAFIDPFFSSGVHLAFTGALSAASSIAASIKQQCSEAEAIAFHHAKVGTSYTRFLLVVLGTYKQIKAQESPVLSDIDEDNFDRAFSFLRPIIQGSADVDPKLTERELQDTMDFCKNVFAPTSPQMHAEVAKRVGHELISPDAPLMSVASVMELAGIQNDDDAKHVLLEVNARKPIHSMYNCDTNFKTEVMSGFCVRMERGQLGLIRA
ncbi:putative halogenase [Mycena metata]|uniref:Halogenase n=1 Tax=Mycena metata TaxID=1033252 RepID=A0AAD7I9N8_9AGAR|nr:putative halogenase [Mycena metata]